MKQKSALFIALAIVAGACTKQADTAKPDDGTAACTEEAKVCPDGSSVSRSGPDCEFPACPGEDQPAGDGALLFARQNGFPECAPESLIVESERTRWDSKHGTVGCVAFVSAAKLAVATSTGGIFNKLPGRVGDSPLIGCGTYADRDGAVSCTGHGEAIVRVVLAREAVRLLENGIEPGAAASAAVAKLQRQTGSTGGLILIDRRGRIGYARNTTCMPVCSIRRSGDVALDS